MFRFRNHRLLWALAALSIIAAFGTAWFREWHEHRGALLVAREQRDSLVKQMMELLQNDSRMRRPVTQQSVTAVARYTELPDLDSAEAYLALGLEWYYKHKKESRAEEAFHEAVQRRPNWSWAYNYWGIALYDLGQKERAHEVFGKAMDLDPKWTRPQNHLAILHRLDGQLDEALEHIEQAYVIDPHDPITHYNHGVLLDKMAESANEESEGRQLRLLARRQYENVIELDPGIPAAHYNLACSFSREGLAEAAIPHLKRAIQLDKVFINEVHDDVDFDPIRESSLYQHYWRELGEIP